MIEVLQKTARWALVAPLTLGLLSGGATAQEGDGSARDIRNVQLVFHLVQADGFTDEDPEISDVATELRKLFSFRGYRLLSTSVLNIGLEPTRTTRMVGTGSQRVIADDLEHPLAIKVDVSGTRGSSETIRARVSLTDVVSWPIRNAVAVDPVDRFLEASVTIRDGQRVVLGSARRSAEEPVLILVVTPRIDPS